MTEAAELHDDAYVIDALVYHSDGYTGDLRAGGVNALNVTVNHFEADFVEACDQIPAWLARTEGEDAEWQVIRQTSDFEAARAAGRIGLVMGWQNCRPLADKPERLHFFHALGLRVMQLTYNYQNFLGCGCLETEDSGLTSFGRDVVAEMNALGIAIDLSHVGARTAMDAIGVSTKPVLATHANATAVTDLARNKSDGMIEAIAGTGGLIGASIYGPMCWTGDPARKPTIDDYLGHLEHIVEVAGIAHVGFGTDLATGRDMRKLALERVPPRRWDGIDRFNAIFGEDIPSRYLADCNAHSDLPRVTEALLARGWRETDIRAYLGGNLIRVLGDIWHG